MCSIEGAGDSEHLIAVQRAGDDADHAEQGGAERESRRGVGNVSASSREKAAPWMMQKEP